MNKTFIRYLSYIAGLATVWGLLSRCYGINSQTSEIGSINSVCLPENAWDKIQKAYPIDTLADSSLSKGLHYVKNHFLSPKYIIYFREEPQEIVGCDWYAIRVVYNPKLCDCALDGLSPQLSDKEQVRIRNRVLKLIVPYACPEGKEELLKDMKEPAVFSKD